MGIESRFQTSWQVLSKKSFVMYKLGIKIDYKNVPVVGSILNQFRVLYMTGVMA